MPRGYLYGIRMCIPSYENCPVKVGFTTDPAKRLKSYQGSGPYPVEWLGHWPTLHGMLDETQIHKKFADHRLSGEWFDPIPEILEMIEINVHEYERLITRKLEEGKTPTGRIPKDVRAWQETAKANAEYEFRRHPPFSIGYTAYCRRCIHITDEDMEYMRTLVGPRSQWEKDQCDC